MIVASTRGTLAALLIAALAVTLPGRSSRAADWQTRLPAFPRYEPGDVVENLISPGGAFRVHYTRAGRNAVAPGDGDNDQIPDHVQLVARVLDGAFAFYRDGLGLRPPLGAAGDTGVLLDSFLVDFSGRGDGQFVPENCRAEPPKICGGLLLLENDFSGYPYGSIAGAIGTVASHELFHAVQAARGADDHAVFAEGTAGWATEAFDGALDDFERAIRGYLTAPDQPLSVVPTGPVSSFSYGGALFFRFLSERFGDAAVASLLAASATPVMASGTPRWMSATAALLERDHGSTFARAFADFAIWNTLTAARAPAADAGMGYRNAARYPSLVTQPRMIPFTDPAMRIFPASARTFLMGTQGRAPLRARLSVHEGAGPLELALVGRRAGVWGLRARDPLQLEATFVAPSDPVAPPDGARATLDEGSELLVVVSNGGLAGASTRATLCVGADEAALAACVSAPPPAGPATASASEGGCSVTPARASASRSAVACLALVFALIGVARRRAHRGRTL